MKDAVFRLLLQITDFRLHDLNLVSDFVIGRYKSTSKLLQNRLQISVTAGLCVCLRGGSLNFLSAI